MNTPLWVKMLRAFAHEPGALLFPMPTRSGKQVAIFADDIRAAGDDDNALLDLVAMRVGEPDELQTAPDQPHQIK